MLKQGAMGVEPIFSPWKGAFLPLEEAPLKLTLNFFIDHELTFEKFLLLS